MSMVPQFGRSPLVGTSGRKHINELVNAYISVQCFLEGRSGARYLAMIPRIASYSDWSTDHRYYRKSALPRSSYGAWRAAAAEVGKVLDAALLDGKR